MAEITERQQEVLDRLGQRKTAPQIARELGISRNAVYQHIQRLRDNGVLDSTYTPTGAPMREKRPGADVLRRVLLQDGDRETERAAKQALTSEMRRTRDELADIWRRLDSIIPD